MNVAMLRPGVELSADPGFAPRVRRLVAVSTVALGVVTYLAATTTGAPLWILTMLATGWLMMPIILAGSLRRPKLRYGLVAPAGLVGGGLTCLCLGWLPDDPTTAVGWTLVTAGVLLGGTLGSWFWYRLAPVPAAMEPPFSVARLALIAVHTGLVVLGVALILSS
jgi:hypothetical protein